MLLAHLLAFGRLLRRLGLDVHPGRMLDVAEALPHVDVRSRDDVYHACRSLLVHRHEDLAIFDRAFDAFWRAAHTTAPNKPLVAPVASVAPVAAVAPDNAPNAPRAPYAPYAPDFDGAREDSTLPALQRTWSDADVLSTKDFADFTSEEMAVARAALTRLVWNPGLRRTRRWVSGEGSRLDLRRAFRKSLRTGGDLLVLPRRARRCRPRPIVLICDISGSMERYSRMLLQFAHAVSHRHRRFEAFLFSTRLTRITADLRVRGLDRAVAAVSRSVPDWSGGTRIGDALRELHVRWARRVLNGGPVVLLISDGWDRGDPAVLRDQVARLHRNCHRLIWLNPLIGTIDYAPLTRGLQAALPYVDDFLPARTLTNLADLAVHLNALGPSVRSRR